MSQSNHNKDSVFQQRSSIQCTEAAFDFLRRNRTNWFRSILILVLPYSVLMALIWLPEVRNRDLGDIYDFIVNKLTNIGQVAYFIPGVYLSVLASCSLLKSAQDNKLQDLSWRQILSVCRGNALRILVAVILISVFVYTFLIVLEPFSVLVLVALVLLVPSWLILPVILFFEKGSGNGIMSPFKMGFSKWFPAFFIEGFMGFIGLMLSLAMVLPCILLLQVADFMGAMSSTLGDLYQQMMSFAALCMALVAVLAGISFISLGICYLYGSGISENNDEIVSENIDNFENL